MAARPKAMLEVGCKTAKHRFAHRRKTAGYARSSHVKSEATLLHNSAAQVARPKAMPKGKR